jgi:hypothetical protein
MDKYLISRYQSGKGKYMLNFLYFSFFVFLSKQRTAEIDLSMMSEVTFMFVIRPTS